MNQLTPEERKAERTSALNDLLTACAVRCPDTPAMTTARLLDSSLRGGSADDAHKHAGTMALLEHALAQVQRGATELNLDAKLRSGVLTNTRRELGLP